ncbi:MAG: hypothetical protein COX07_09625 [Bacteroidetes bacterium CG23_combo_of_CG06-09_8_20_14_all_32_9]|nr:MAG: hypothetical protein COX07_09625 [Bacteroidetes bacterium CG23_combo_of_CG06-09_8_20_14_all_32_9]
MEKDKTRYGVSEEYNQFNVKSTVGSFSFNKEDYSVMNQFRDGLQFLTKERTLSNPNVELVFVIMQVTSQNTIKLLRIEKEFRLKFYPSNDLYSKKISGKEYKILQIATTKEINTIAQYGKKAIKKFNVPKTFFSIIEVIMSTALWRYVDVDGKEYCCFIRISPNGNIYIFKHFLPLN